METTQKQQLDDFNAAKQIALSIPKGHMKRARSKDDKYPLNYIGYKDNNGRMFVIGDSLDDISNPDCLLFAEKLPAREVFGKFTIMSK